jgi:hypothetical protein
MQVGNRRKPSEALVWQWVKISWNDDSIEHIIVVLKSFKSV